MFHNKYLKYKQKYLKLKKSQEGGKVPCNKGYQNLFGTCWAIAIQMMFTFGKATSDDLEKNMRNLRIGCDYENMLESINCFIERQIQKVKSNVSINDLLLEISEEKIKYLKIILKKFIDRYYNKALEIKISEKPEGVINLMNPERCELVISQNFNKLFDDHILLSSKESYGGNILSEYLFCNLISIFLLEYKVSFKKYYDRFNEINFNVENDIGIILVINNHACCFYFCDSPKFYNDWDKTVKEFDWITLLKTSTINNLYIEKDFGIRQIDNIELYDGNKLILSKVKYLIVVSKFDKYTSLDIDIKNILKLRSLDKIEDKEIQNHLAIYYSLNENKKKAIDIWKNLVDQDYESAYTWLGIMFEDINPEKAREYYNMGILRGIKESQYNLGKMLFDGKGIEKNQEEGIKLFRLAANQGHTNAQYDLGKILSSVKGNEVEAAQFLGLAALNENINAQYHYGIMLYFGRGVEKNVKDAILFFWMAKKKKEAQLAYSILSKGKDFEDQYKEGLELLFSEVNQENEKDKYKFGNPEAQYKLGKIFMYNESTENELEGTNLFRLAADQGNTNARFELGKIYYNVRIYDESVRNFRIAAEKGNANAQFELGKMLYNGIGVQQNKEEAMQLFQLASEQGNANAQFELGKILLLKKNTALDAIKLFNSAADQGNENALFELAKLLFSGLYVQEDKPKAIRILRFLVEKGNVNAQFYLGNALYFGNGVSKDTIEGMRLLKLSADKGDKRAKTIIDQEEWVLL
jgi:TPR repeat protein